MPYCYIVWHHQFILYTYDFQADQRKGRTGRTCDGQVFRLVPKDVFYSFYEFESPAIQLLSLREQVLSITCAESKAINDPTGKYHVAENSSPFMPAIYFLCKR